MFRRLTAAGVACAATFALAGALPAAAQEDSAATEVTFTENGGSGISGALTIDGQAVDGTATGLDPDGRYISLYYGGQSTGEQDRLLTCADARTAAAPRAWGITPEWEVGPDGSGALSGTAPRGTDGVETVSIRAVPDGAPTDPYVGFDPVRYPVVACGQVGAGPALPTDDVASPGALTDDLMSGSGLSGADPAAGLPALPGLGLG